MAPAIADSSILGVIRCEYTGTRWAAVVALKPATAWTRLMIWPHPVGAQSKRFRPFYDSTTRHRTSEPHPYVIIIDCSTTVHQNRPDRRQHRGLVTAFASSGTGSYRSVFARGQGCPSYENPVAWCGVDSRYTLPGTQARRLGTGLPGNALHTRYFIVGSRKRACPRAHSTHDRGHADPKADRDSEGERRLSVLQAIAT